MFINFQSTGRKQIPSECVNPCVWEPVAEGTVALATVEGGSGCALCVARALPEPTEVGDAERRVNHRQALVSKGSNGKPGYPLCGEGCGDTRNTSSRP